MDPTKISENLVTSVEVIFCTNLSGACSEICLGGCNKKGNIHPPFTKLPSCPARPYYVFHVICVFLYNKYLFLSGNFLLNRRTRNIINYPTTIMTDDAFLFKDICI